MQLFILEVSRNYRLRQKICSVHDLLLQHKDMFKWRSQSSIVIVIWKWTDRKFKRVPKLYQVFWACRGSRRLDA